MSCWNFPNIYKCVYNEQLTCTRWYILKYSSYLTTTIHIYSVNQAVSGYPTNGTQSSAISVTEFPGFMAARGKNDFSELTEEYKVIINIVFAHTNKGTSFRVGKKNVGFNYPGLPLYYYSCLLIIYYYVLLDGAQLSALSVYGCKETRKQNEESIWQYCYLWVQTSYRLPESPLPLGSHFWIRSF